LRRSADGIAIGQNKNDIARIKGHDLALAERMDRRVQLVDGATVTDEMARNAPVLPSS
jgi:hypothetical protein